MRLEACVFTVVFAAGAAQAGGKVRLSEAHVRNLQAPAAEQVCRAVAALAQAQVDHRGSEATWEWTQGSGPADNTAGIVALALSRGPECGQGAALRRYAEARVRRHQREEFLFDPDIEALASLGAVEKSARLAAVAREAFARRYSGASGEEAVARWLMLRSSPALVGFDAAHAIRAALAVGDRAKALELADAMVAQYGRWAEGDDPGQVRTTARGAMLEVLLKLEPTRYAPTARDLVHHLVLAQGSDGSWGRTTQATAYALKGLALSAEPAAADAAGRARRWLKATQLEGGAWATFNDYLPEPFVGDRIPEVTAEVVLALAP